MSTTTPAAALIAALDTIGVADPATVLANDPDVTFAALEVDSLGIIEVISRLEADCGIVVPDDDLSIYVRPADLLAAAHPQREAA